MQNFIAKWVIRNQGNKDAGAFTLVWTFHEQTGIGVCDMEYENLAAGDTVWGGCNLVTNAGPASYRSTLTVDFDDDIPESDEDNRSNVTLTVRRE